MPETQIRTVDKGWDDSESPPEMRHAVITTKPASWDSVMTVLKGDDDGDGRSEWLWVRFPNGDLMLACYPQGECYFNTETDHC